MVRGPPSPRPSTSSLFRNYLINMSGSGTNVAPSKPARGSETATIALRPYALLFRLRISTQLALWVRPATHDLAGVLRPRVPVDGLVPRQTPGYQGIDVDGHAADRQPAPGQLAL